MTNNDFFDIDTGLSDDQLEEFRHNTPVNNENHQEKEYKNPQGYKNPQEYENVNTSRKSTSFNSNGVELEDRNWLIICMSCLLLSTFIMLNILGYSPFQKPDIVRVGSNKEMEMTVSEVINTSFRVKNKTHKDISGETVWTLNGEYLTKGKNEVNLEISDINWGLNTLIATNGETVIDYNFTVTKGIEPNDEIHTALSLLADDLPEYSFYKTNEFIPNSQENLSEILTSSSYYTAWGGGLFKTTQGNKQFNLETYEETLFNLSIGKVLYLNTYKDYCVSIHGDWSNVQECILYFTPDEVDSVETLKPVKFIDGKAYDIERSNYSKSGDSIAVTITENCIIGFIPTGEIKSDVIYTTVTLELTDNINLGLSGQNTSKKEEASSQNESQTPLEEYNSYLQNIADEIISQATSKSSRPITSNQYQFKDGYLKDITNNTINKCDFSKLFSDYIGRPISTVRYYSLNFIVDTNKCDSDKVKELLDFMNAAAEYYSDYDINIIITKKAKTNNLDSLDSLLDNKEPNLFIYDTANTRDYLENILYNLDTNLETVLNIDNTEVNVNVIKDIKFDTAKNGISTPCPFNQELQFGSWWGQCLVSKLGFQKQLTYEMFESADIVYDENLFTTDKNLKNPDRAMVFISKQDINNLNKNGINTVNFDLEPIVNFMSLNIANELENNFVSLYNFENGLVYTDLIEPIKTELSHRKPVMAMIKSNYGYQSVLITAIYQDKQDFKTFYVKVYDPMNPLENNIIQIKVNRGQSNVNNELGWTYEMKYTGLYGLEFSEIYIVDNVVCGYEYSETLGIGG